MGFVMNEAVEERRFRLNEMHKAWFEVTSSALVELHKTDGYKGDKHDYRAALTAQKRSLCVAGQLEK